MACQICFDDDIPIASNNDIGGALCRRSCTARVCVSCLARHIEVSLAGFYAGVLPLIRCPICLLPMRVDRWTRPLTAELTAKSLTALRKQYETLCKQACSLTTPCCHKMNYPHLPKKDLSFKETSRSLALLPSKVVEFRKLVARFCGHRIEARSIIVYATKSFGDGNACELVESTLPRIADSERRARLLLAFLYKFPNIKTRCCKFAMCFNCKRMGHHDKCDDFDEAVDESECLVRCRNCRVMLMKVEGCDVVDCVCGFRMSWLDEVKIRDLSHKKALPVDLFDEKAVDNWQEARDILDKIFHELERKHEQLRKQRLDSWIHKHKDLVYHTVECWVWRYRWRVPMTELVKHHKHIRRERLDAWIQTYKVIMSSSVGRWVWRIRFSKALVRIERELFWRAYYRTHPEERAVVQEDTIAFFMMDV
jgi:hypothetical protein